MFMDDDNIAKPHEISTFVKACYMLQDLQEYPRLLDPCGPSQAFHEDAAAGARPAARRLAPAPPG